MPDITGVAGQQVVEQGLRHLAQPPGGGEVNPADQAKFDQAMKGDVVEGIEGLPDSGVAEVSDPNAVPGQPETMGDTILQGLQNLKVDHDVRMGNIQNQLQAVGTDEMSFSDAMKLQMDVMQLTLQEDLATKVADKTSQGVQTMFKNQ